MRIRKEDDLNVNVSGMFGSGCFLVNFDLFVINEVSKRAGIVAPCLRLTYNDGFTKTEIKRLKTLVKKNYKALAEAASCRPSPYEKD